MRADRQHTPHRKHHAVTLLSRPAPIFATTMPLAWPRPALAICVPHQQFLTKSCAASTWPTTADMPARANLRLLDGPDPLRNLATDKRMTRLRNGGDDRGPYRHILSIRPLHAHQQQPPRHAASQSARHLEREPRSTVGLEVHRQHQHRDELLDGRIGESRRSARATLRPSRLDSPFWLRDCAQILQRPRIRRAITTPTSGAIPFPWITCRQACGLWAQRGSRCISSRITRTASTRPFCATAPIRASRKLPSSFSTISSPARMEPSSAVPANRPRINTDFPTAPRRASACLPPWTPKSFAPSSIAFRGRSKILGVDDGTSHTS